MNITMIDKDKSDVFILNYNVIIYLLFISNFYTNSHYYHIQHWLDRLYLFSPLVK